MLGQPVCGSKMECCTCNYDFPSLWHLFPPEALLQPRECFVFVVANAFPVHLASPLNKMQLHVKNLPMFAILLLNVFQENL